MAAENSIVSISSIKAEDGPVTTGDDTTVSSETGPEIEKGGGEQQAAKMWDIVRIKREIEEGQCEEDQFYEKCPQNYKQPIIFELARRETLKKMGKLSKEAVIQRVLHKVIFIRESDIPMPEYDPTATEEIQKQELPTSTELSEEHDDNVNANELTCPNNLPYCQLGCVCSSVNCPDMYDDFYEKHCRDTGDPECMFGCICENPGPHINNGESRWITCKPYKYKKQRVRDDEDCGFVPIHMREQMKEGRPKRKAQAPTRYRPDFSVSEKEMRAYENGNSNSSSGNGFSTKKTSRPRRRLCEEDDENGSDDSDERIITDKKRKLSVSDSPSAPKKGRPTKQQAAKNLLREPSKRERKPRNLDLPEPEPRRKIPAKKTDVVNGVGKTPSVVKGKVKVPEEVEDTCSVITVPFGTSLHVIDIQPASKTCQGMFAVLRKITSEIVTFVTWDEGSNSRPYLLDLKYRFTSSRQNQPDLDEGNDVLTLPHVKTQDTMWLFYSIKRNFMNWDTIMCRELHSIIKSKLLLEIIERYRPLTMRTKVSRVVDISHINSNKREEPAYKCPPLYLFIGKYGDVYWFGCPPRVYVEKNINTAGANSNVLVKRRQEVQRHYRSQSGPRKLKPKGENSLTTSTPVARADSPPLVLNNNDIITKTSAEDGQGNVPVEMKMETVSICQPEEAPRITSGSLSSVSELTTPEVFPPSPAPDPSSAVGLSEENYQLLLD